MGIYLFYIIYIMGEKAKKGSLYYNAYFVMTL